jgi:hypothetical protein
MIRKMFKRGISPLIATMLLISLSVSIGATIMSVGGLYYEKVKLEGPTCSKVLINAFELGDDRKCQSNIPKSILNFYDVNENIGTPECYEVVATGKGEVCTTSNVILNVTWSPIGNIIK